MPSTKVKRARGGVVRVRTIKRNGTTFRVYVFRRKGPRGGRTYAEPVKAKR